MKLDSQTAVSLGVLCPLSALPRDCRNEDVREKGSEDASGSLHRPPSGIRTNDAATGSTVTITFVVVFLSEPSVLSVSA